MSSAGEIVAGTAVELVITILAAGLVYRVWGGVFAVPRRQVVPPFQCGVVLCDGVVEKVLNPGTHWVTPRRTLLLCDLRPRPFQVTAQELVTSDGMAVRIGLGGEYRIADPAAFVTGSTDAFGAVFLELREALQTAVKELSSVALLSGESTIAARIREILVPRATQLGIEVTHLQVWDAVPLGWVRTV